MTITVEQTTQLIQLILNSALMMAIALAWWGVVWLRHGAIATQLQTHLGRLARLREAGEPDVEQLAHLKQLRLQLQARYRLTRQSWFIMHCVLLALVGSVFSLALRTLLSGNWLIPVALVLFVAGIGGLLLSVGLALMEFYQLGLLEEGVASRGRRRSVVKALPGAVRSGVSATAAKPASSFSERIAS
ncbi:MAG TPA: hypothetical protein V6D06_07755 [Trichocoleus sp.]